MKALVGQGNIFDSNFNINSHPSFVKTRLVVKAAIKNSSREDANKKTMGIHTIGEEKEVTIL